MSEGLEADRASPEKDLTLGAFKVKFEDDDLKNPKNYSSSHKAFLVIQMAMLALAGSLDSSIISPAATSIAEYTYTASEVTPLTVALFVLDSVSIWPHGLGSNQRSVRSPDGYVPGSVDSGVI
ncbi:unnamed protein product [Penicillium pancosmium]